MTNYGVSLGGVVEQGTSATFNYPPRGYISTFLNFPELFQQSTLSPNSVSSEFANIYDRTFLNDRLSEINDNLGDDLAYPKYEAATLFARSLGIIDGSIKNGLEEGTELWKLIVRVRPDCQSPGFYKENNYLHARTDRSESTSPANEGAQDMLYLYSQSETGHRSAPLVWKGIQSQKYSIKNFNEYLELLKSELAQSVDLDNRDPFEVSSRDKVRAVIVGAAITAAMNGEKGQCEQLICLLPNDDRARIELAHLGMAVDKLE